MPGAALAVARQIERLHHLLAELGGLGKNWLDQIWRGVGKARKIVVARDLEHVVQQKQDLIDGGLVDRHGDLSRAANGKNSRASSAMRTQASAGHESWPRNCQSSNNAASVGRPRTQGNRDAHG